MDRRSLFSRFFALLSALCMSSPADQLDGRESDRWIASVIAYLEWRSASILSRLWPRSYAYHRNKPDVAAVMGAINILNQSQRVGVGCHCVHCSEGHPFFDERPAPQLALVFAKAVAA
jgi:hypothetical protein